jgi:arylsulfatase A-like enzyme
MVGSEPSFSRVPEVGEYKEDAFARPNIVLIVADDMGYSDVGCFGGEIETPHLDRLGYEGIRFSHMYNTARCCPSRASLLTGLHPHQTGVGHLTYDLGHPAYHGSLNERCVTLAEVLRAAGYATLMSGKWHVTGAYPSGREGQTPLHWGFDRWFGTLAGAGSFYDPPGLCDDGEPVRLLDRPFYYTDAISDRAVGFIDEYGAGPRPFFLYVAYTAPHWPLHALQEDIERYRGRYRRGWDATRTARHERLKEMGLLDPRWPISARDELVPPWPEAGHHDWEDARMATYAAQVDRMDQGIGRIVDALQRNGAREDTLLLFLSDNGGCAEFLREDGHLERPQSRTRDGRLVRPGNAPGTLPGPADTYMSYGLAWANVSNAPFRLYKHWVHEGGISTPLIASWPRWMARPAIEHELLHLVDLMATCVDVAGARYPDEFQGRPILPLEGQSFAPLLYGQRWQREGAICWEHEGNRAVRAGQWKLVSMHPGRWELYDMSRDGTEGHDLSGRYRDTVKELAQTWDEWADRCGVPPWEEIAPREEERVRRWEEEHGLRVYETGLRFE